MTVRGTWAALVTRFDSVFSGVKSGVASALPTEQVDHLPSEAEVEQALAHLKSPFARLSKEDREFVLGYKGPEVSGPLNYDK